MSQFRRAARNKSSDWHEWLSTGETASQFSTAAIQVFLSLTLDVSHPACHPWFAQNIIQPIRGLTNSSLFSFFPPNLSLLILLYEVIEFIPYKGMGSWRDFFSSSLKLSGYSALVTLSNMQMSSAGRQMSQPKSSWLSPKFGQEVRFHWTSLKTQKIDGTFFAVSWNYKKVHISPPSSFLAGWYSTIMIR